MPIRLASPRPSSPFGRTGGLRTKGLVDRLVSTIAAVTLSMSSSSEDFLENREGHCQRCSLGRGWGPCHLWSQTDRREAGGSSPSEHSAGGTGPSGDSERRSEDPAIITETDRPPWLMNFGRLTPNKGSHDNGIVDSSQLTWADCHKEVNIENAWSTPTSDKLYHPRGAAFPRGQ